MPVPSDLSPQGGAAALSALAVIVGVSGLSFGAWVAVPVGDVGLERTFYADEELSELVLTDRDGAIDHRWGKRAPVPGVPADHFSIAWTGCLIVPHDDMYLFVRADEGVRVDVGGKRVVARWGAPTTGFFRSPASLPAGVHPIRVEYREATNAATVYLGWAEGIGAHHPIPATAFAPPGRADCPGPS